MSTAVPKLVGNQCFQVYFGSTLISFARIRNVQRTAEPETLAEGGINDYVHILSRPDSQGGTLTMEKGIIADKSATKVMKALAPGTRINVPVTITLCNDRKPIRSWGFEDGLVTGWEVGDLDGLGSEIALEKLTITHSGLEELEV